MNFWCQMNGMFVNHEKSHFIVTKNTEDIALTIDDVPLRQRETTTLIGFVINERLDFKDYINKLLKKFSRNTRLLLATRHLMNRPLALKFY